MGWVLEELGVSVRWPMKIWTDYVGAKSSAEDTCRVSKIKGSFDYRARWVEELKEEKQIEIGKVKDVQNLADILTKCYPTYKFKTRLTLVRECREVVRSS